MKNTVLIIAIGIALTACGGEAELNSAQVDNGSTDETLEIGAANEPSVVTAEPVETTDQTTEAENTDAVATNEVVEPAVAADSESLSVSNTFSFATARTVDVDFDLEEARNHTASVSICTSFEPEGGVFGVDYDSCAVQGEMVNGVFHHSMEVTNDVESVAGVVWFQNNALPPMMQVFSVAHDTAQAAGLTAKDRTVSSSGGAQRIVWR